MNKLFILLRPSFYGILGINKLLKSEDAGKKRKLGLRILLYALLFFSLLFCVFIYASAMTSALAAVGKADLVLPLFMAADSLLTLILTIFRVDSTLYRSRDYDQQMSLPVPKSTVATAKLLTIYGYNLIYTLGIMIPAFISLLCWTAPPNPVFVAVFFFTLLILPMLPLVIAALLGTVISWIAAHFRKTTGMRTVLIFLLGFGTMAFSFSVNSLEDRMGDIGEMLSNTATRIYLPSQWYLDALQGNVVSLLLLVGVSLAAFILLSLLLGRYYPQLHTFMESITPQTKRVDITHVRTHGLFRTMLSKERKRFFASPTWVTNTLFGQVMLLIGAIALIFMKPEQLADILQIPGLDFILRRGLPFVIAFFISTVSIAAASVSMEGKQMWIIRTSPISGKLFLYTKVVWNLLAIMVPVLPISVILTLVLEQSALDCLQMLFINLLYAGFISMFGGYLNLCFPKLDWKNDANVIKQSMPVGITMLTGMAVTVPPIVLLLLLPEQAMPVVLISVAVMVLLNVVLILLINRNAERLLGRIQL